MSFDEMLGAIREVDGAGDGDAELVDATRLRVMRSLEARARSQHRLVGFATMVGILLVGTVSWALATGQVAALWTPTVEPRIEPVPPPAPPAPPPRRRPARAPTKKLPAAAPAETTPEAPAAGFDVLPELPDDIPDVAPEMFAPAVPEVVPAAPEVAPAAPIAPAMAIDPRPPQPEIAPPEAVPAPPPPRPAATPPRRAPAAPVEVLYRKAHELHFHGGDPAATLAAWDAYLAAEPDGRFSIEARYNRALVLIRLGRYVAARAALAPFARGEVAPHGYRQAEAEQLFERLARYE